jgi:hypothetical protein
MRFFLLGALLLFSGCDCSGGGGVGDSCSTEADCNRGLECVDGRCTMPDDVDGGRRDAGMNTERDAGPGCPSAVFCGTPPACCDLGEECVEGACLAACASGVRCGADLATCCGAAQVCVSNACVDPGEECTDSFECEDGSFCEPTLGRCLTQFDPVTCETEPVFGAFAVTEEWRVDEATAEPNCIHAITVPAIVDIDGDTIPEVVASFSCSGITSGDWRVAVLRAYRGTDGSHLWSATANDLRLWGRASIAAADLDGEPGAEIVGVQSSVDGVTPTYRLIAFNGDGTLLWLSTDTDGTTPYSLGSRANNGAPTIADLDEDGSPEVIFGATVFNSDGVLQWRADLGAEQGSNGTYYGGIAAVADLDGAGHPEVITGNRAYRFDGTPFWTSPSEPDGFPAIAQFDADPQPEVVIVSGGHVRYVDGLTGVLEWGPVQLTVPVPGTDPVGIGGPPTVADFDGDGRPEIGVAGASSYTVFDPDEADDILWSMPTQDRSSNTTGSSVFDFEGDGAAEVIYADECYMRVYSGRDGSVLLRIANSTATIHEYPLVADIDADGNSEIAIVANNRSSSLRTQCVTADSTWNGARAGIFVYGDARDQWMRTRRVWNQHAYHVTNVNADGTIPMIESDNWTAPDLNNYRQNAQGEGVFNAPDLKVLALEVSLLGCPENATLRARISNEGSLGVPAGVPVAFYRGATADPAMLIGVVTTTVPLLPGASTVVEIDAPLIGEPPFTFLAVADDDGAGAGIITECDEDDNGGAIGDVTCDILF